MKKKEIAISVKKLQKTYNIGSQKGSIRDLIVNKFRLKKTENIIQFDALKNINFDIYKGEAVGIIGKNGAGKSTLLKTLSKITYPTAGYIEIYGKVSSLLEVGTGFHPELTGRENIFLNGTILGMSRNEVKSKFDEIVDFSGVKNFLDTPVKRYSSGMYVRLAFSVAAHLEPEILIIDEVLAVGDAEFQKKCLGKMDKVAKTGRTVLFVSHNMDAVQQFCSRSILLEKGEVLKIGKTSEVISKYLNLGSGDFGSKIWKDINNSPGNEIIRLKSINILGPKREPHLTVDTGLQIVVKFKSFKEKLNLGITLYIFNEKGILLFETGKVITENKDSLVGIYEAQVLIPPHLLNSGIYYGKLLFGESQRYVLADFENIISFEILHTSTGRDNNFSKAPGVIRPQLEWQAKRING
jgi:lipopolysaccharide transport system ATP-binding protein